MNIDKIRSEIKSLKGKNVIAKVCLGRNKYEYVEGIIYGIYPYVFTIKSGDVIKSYSYSDLLTKSVILKIN